MSDELKIAAYGLSRTRETINLDNMYVNGRYLTNAGEPKVSMSKVTRGDFQVYGVCDAGGASSNRQNSAANAALLFSELQELQSDLTEADKIIKDKIWTFLKNSNEQIAARNEEVGQYAAGVSYAGLFLHGNHGLAVHIGDSRIYVIRGNRILQITEDHLEFTDLYHKGIITQEQMDIHKKDSQLFAYLGMDDIYEVQEEVFSKYFIYYPGDIFLICTDGVSDTLRNGDLEKLVRSQKGNVVAADIAQEIMKRAIENNEDDCTLLMLEIEEAQGEAPQRGGATIPRKENFADKENKAGEENTSRLHSIKEENDQEQDKETVRQRRIQQVLDDEYDDDGYDDGPGLMDRLRENPRLVAIALSLVIIVILFIILIFKIAGNGGKNENSQGGQESSYNSQEISQEEESSQNQESEESKESEESENSQENESSQEEESSQESENSQGGVEVQTYTVVKGDSIYRIMMKFYNTYSEDLAKAFAAYNQLDDKMSIFPGQLLRIPDLSVLRG